MSASAQIFSLKQVLSSIRKTIEERYTQVYWVKAEMHKLNQFPSGHCFPELLQKENGTIVAQIRGTIWKHNFERINNRFVQVVKEPLKEDTTLLLQVKVTFHENYGLSLQILDIDPSYALGELHRERLETLKKLKEEDLINANQQLDFPLLPKRVAVISAEASKGLSDFNSVLEQNSFGYNFFTMLFQAYLQGDNAASSIIEQLKRIEKVKHRFDIVVIVRGGGGEVGLSCYNDYQLCKEIASFPIPVLTGIGHSTNLTVAEMISYRNAITPTELGDFLLQAFHNFSVPLKDAVKSISHSVSTKINTTKNELNSTTQTFRLMTLQRLSDTQNILLNKGVKLKTGVRFSIQYRRESIEKSKHLTINGSRLMLQEKRIPLVQLKDKVAAQSKAFLMVNDNRIKQMEQSVRLMDPINVLKRGFSITTIDGKTIDKSKKLEKGAKIITKTASFIVESEITSKKENNE